MAFNAYVGSFDSNLSTGNQPVTGVGFTPKLVIFYHIRNDTAASNTTNARWGMGAMDGTNEWSIAAIDVDNVATSQADRRQLTSKCITTQSVQE